MKKIIVYFPYKLREATSGSAVRPKKLLEAFESTAKIHGVELIKIFGESHDRKELLMDLYKNINPNDILFCYMENATIPIWLSDTDHIPKEPFLDLNFFRYLKKNRIPLGVFYRDIYWRFNELYKVNPIIKPFMKLLFTIELNIFKRYASIFYLPSFYMNDFVQADNRKVTDLPPGGVNLLHHQKIGDSNSVMAIYVGGINPRYGIYETLEAFKLINSKANQIQLTLVCRKEEYETYKDLMAPYAKFNWLEIKHAYGEQLIPLYEKADFGIVPIKRDTYNDFAVAVKLFEYISYGLPVIATDCNAQRDLVDSSNLGIVVSDDVEGIKKGLEEFLNPSIRIQYKDSVKKALINKHLWVHRAEKVFETLLK